MPRSKKAGVSLTARSQREGPLLTGFARDIGGARGKIRSPTCRTQCRRLFDFDEDLSTSPGQPDRRGSGQRFLRHDNPTSVANTDKNLAKLDAAVKRVLASDHVTKRQIASLCGLITFMAQTVDVSARSFPALIRAYGAAIGGFQTITSAQRPAFCSATRSKKRRKIPRASTVRGVDSLCRHRPRYGGSAPRLARERRYVVLGRRAHRRRGRREFIKSTTDRATKTTASSSVIRV